MKLVLIRDIKTPTFTLGRLQCGKYEFFTCEDAIREEKIPGETAIPAGLYKVVITFSNRFQKHLPLLLDVPSFSGIRIHSGNTAGDTEGCILVGTMRAKDKVTNSRYAMSVLQPLIEDDMRMGNDVWLEIKE